MSKHENTKKIILVDQVKDGKTYGTLNDTYVSGVTGVSITSDNSVTVKEGEEESSNKLRRVGYLLPIVDANPKLIAQTDNDGLVYTPLENSEVVNEVPVPQDFHYETVSLPHYYNLVPTHELAYTVSGKSYHFYRVRMKNSPIAHIRLKQALSDPYFVAKDDAGTKVYASSYVDASSMGNPDTPELTYYVPLPSKVSSSTSLLPIVTFNKGLADELTIESKDTVENFWSASVPEGSDAPFKHLEIYFVPDSNSQNSNSLNMVFRFYDSSNYDHSNVVHILPTALTKYKTITLEIRDGYDVGSPEETCAILYTDQANNYRVYEYVDTKKFDLDFPHAGEESFVWTQHIVPLNDVSSAVPVSEDMKGIYDVVDNSGIEMFHNTNKAIGKIHRLEQEQTVQITDDCLCILDATNADNNWYQVVHATSPTPLWIDHVAFSNLSKSESYVDRLAILIDDTQQSETLEKVVVVSEVVHDGTVIKYKYLKFDDDKDATTPDQTTRVAHDEYSFTSYAVEQGGEELAHGKIKVVNRTDAYSEVVVIENSVAGWVDDTHYFINSADTFMVDKDGNKGRINLYTDNTLTQKVSNGSSGDMWVKIEGAEHGLLDGDDVKDSMSYADPEKLAFLVPLPRGKDGMLANLTTVNGEQAQQGELVISPNPVQLYEFYETSGGSRQRQFVIIKDAENKSYQIYEVEKITFAMEGGNAEPSEH